MVLYEKDRVVEYVREVQDTSKASETEVRCAIRVSDGFHQTFMLS